MHRRDFLRNAALLAAGTGTALRHVLALCAGIVTGTHQYPTRPDTTGRYSSRATPAQWFRSYPVARIGVSGRENRIPLRQSHWGLS